MRALIRRESQHTNNNATPNPAVVAVPQSIPQPQPMTPAAAPISAPAPVAPDPVVPMPTPAQVAVRITPPAPTSTGRPATVSATSAPASRTRPAEPVDSRAPLAPPATDTPITAPGAAQPLPTLIDPVQLDRARDEAAQYRTETGAPIRAVQLARRMKVSSEQAARLLAAIEADQPNPTRTTVNGHAMKANR